MKRFFSWLLVLCMVLTLLPGNVFAAEIVASGECGAQGDNVTWTLDSDGLLTISGSGEMKDYTFQGSPFYQFRDRIQSIVISEGVTSVGAHAFYACKKLTSVVIPTTVTALHTWAFCSCTSLPEVILPYGLESIGESAFSSCKSISSIVLPECLKRIDSDAFSGCSFRTILLPACLEQIDPWAFNLCDSHTAITVEEGSAFFSARDGILFNKDGTELLIAPKGLTGAYIIPDGVTKIGRRAFANCKFLTDMSLPETVKELGHESFSNCTNLQHITFSGEISIWGSSVFNSCSSMENIIIPEGMTAIGDSAFAYCTKLQSVLLPSSLRSIGGGAFLDCTSLHGISIPESVEVIGELAFYNTRLETIVLPQKISKIEYGTFKDTTLKSITIHAGLMEIDRFAFDVRGSSIEVFFDGTEEEWKQIKIGSNNDPLLSATIHFNSTGSDEPIDSYARPDVMDPSTLFSSVTPDLVLEYTALAKLAYSNLDSACVAKDGMQQNQNGNGKKYLAPDSSARTVRELVQAGKHCEYKNDAKDKIWSNRTATYTQFYSDLIGDYEVVAVMNRNKDSGLYAMCLRDPQGNYVVSYRGSEGLHMDQLAKYFTTGGSAPNDDWTSTDFHFALESKLSPQFNDALEFYNDVLQLYCGGDQSRLTVTGHSLGGALATYVSMVTNARTYTIDGADGHVVDLALYYGWPSATRFKGTDQFNFINLTDAETQFVANAIQTVNAGYYPMIEYVSENYLNTTEQEKTFLELGGTHHAMSYITYQEVTKNFMLNAEAKRYTTRSDFKLTVKNIKGLVSRRYGHIVLGTSGNNDLSLKKELLDSVSNNVLFGGSGSDTITGSLGRDYIAANSGTSKLYGLSGADTYVLYSGSTGSVQITDPAGGDTILLCGWSEAPNVSVTKAGAGSVSLSIDGLQQKVTVSAIRKLLSSGIRVQYLSPATGKTTTLIDNIFSSGAGASAMDAALSAAIYLENTDTAHVYDASDTEVFTYTRSSEPAVNEYGQFYSTEDGILVYLANEGYHLQMDGGTTSTIQMYTLDAEGAVTQTASYALADLSGATVYAADNVVRCGDETLTPQTVTVPVQDVAMNQHELTLQPGAQETLQAVVSPDDATDAAVHWQTSDAEIVSVTEQGVIKALKPGKANICAVTKDGAFDICAVTVTGDLTKQTAVLSETEFVYDGEQHTPAVTIEGLTLDVDYEVTYENGTEVGPAYAVVTGIGAYTGELRLPYEIKSPDVPTPPTPSNPFTDVPSDQYYYAPVLWAVNHKPQITNGTSKTTFSPDATCTRGQVVTFLWRAKGCPEPKSAKNPFTDVPADAYYFKAILWANETGVTNGTSPTTFSPEAPCTRAHVVTFLWRAESKPAAGKQNPFTDVPAGQYYTDAVLWAVSKNITNGTSPTTFSPDNPCTRGQIVTFLYRDMK